MSGEKFEVSGHGRQEMKYRVQRQDDNGQVFTVPHEGVWYDDLSEAEALKRKLEQSPHKQHYWIEDEEGQRVPSVYSR
jgi:dsDNA-binding SOS-regulon protein